MILNYIVYVDENKMNRILLYGPESGLKGSKSIVDILNSQHIKISHSGEIDIAILTDYYSEELAHILLSEGSKL